MTTCRRALPVLAGAAATLLLGACSSGTTLAEPVAAATSSAPAARTAPSAVPTLTQAPAATAAGRAGVAPTAAQPGRQVTVGAAAPVSAAAQPAQVAARQVAAAPAAQPVAPVVPAAQPQAVQPQAVQPQAIVQAAPVQVIRQPGITVQAPSQVVVPGGQQQAPVVVQQGGVSLSPALPVLATVPGQAPPVAQSEMLLHASVTQQVSYLQAGMAAQAHQMMSRRCQARGSYNAWVASVPVMGRWVSGGITEYSARIWGDRAAVDFRLDGTKLRAVDQPWVLEDGSWRNDGCS